MTLLNQEFVYKALEAEKSGEQFPIDLDDVWQKLGYYTKQNALRRLESVLSSNLDFLSFGMKSPTGGRPSQSIRMSVDGFKHFCLLAETPEGREVRKYFIEVEKAYREQLNRLFIAPPSNSDEIDRLNELVQTHLIESKQLADALIRSEARVQELTEIVNQNGLQSDKSAFDYDLDFLWDVTGIKSRGYLIGILLENFKAGVDFITTPDVRPRKGGLPKTKYWITKQCHDLLVIALRSLRGVDVSDLPETLHIDRDAFFRESNSKKANARFGKKK